MSDASSPDPSDEMRRIFLQSALDLQKMDRQAEIDRAAAQRNSKYELEKAKWSAEYEQGNAYHAAIVAHSTASLDRAIAGAEFVEKAAAAIGVIYAGLLGLVFVADKNPMPARGAIAALFLGLAIALAAAYLAFLKKASQVPGRKPASGLRKTQEERTFFYERWVRAGVMSRRYSARAAVIALAVGVMFLPAAFIGTSPSSTLEVPSSAPTPNMDIQDATQRQRVFDEELLTYREQTSAALALAVADEPEQEAAWWSAAVWLALTGWGLLAVFGLPAAYEQIEREHEQHGDSGGWLIPAIVVTVALGVITIIVLLLAV